MEITRPGLSRVAACAQGKNNDGAAAMSVAVNRAGKERVEIMGYANSVDAPAFSTSFPPGLLASKTINRMREGFSLDGDDASAGSYWQDPGADIGREPVAGPFGAG